MTFMSRFKDLQDRTSDLTISLLRPSDAVITEYYILMHHFNSRFLLQLCILSMHSKKIEYSTNNVVGIYFNFKIVNLRNTSLLISLMSRNTAAVCCNLASVGNVYNICYR